MAADTVQPVALRNRWSHRTAGLLSGVLTLIAALAVSTLAWTSARRDRDQLLESTTRFVIETLQSNLDAIEREALAIAAVASSSELLTDDEFSIFVDKALAVPNVIGRGLVVARIDDQGEVTYSFELWETGDEGPDWTGTDVIRPRILHPIIRRAVETGTTQASGFLSVGMEREATLVFTPTVPGTRSGIAAAVLVDVEGLRAATITETLAADVTVDVFEATPTPTGSFTATHPITLGERHYQVQVTPVDGSPVHPIGTGWWAIPAALSLAAAVAIGVGTAVIVERRRVRAELVAAQAKDQARMEFLASVSHELRTPITAMTGFTQLLRDGWDQSSEEERQELVKLADEQGQEVAAMVTDLLVLARADRGPVHLSMQDVALREVARRVVGSVPTEHAERLAVDVPDITVYGDPTRLAQIFRNLVMNAVIHGEGTITFTGYNGASDIVLRVTDQGDGIPPEAVESVFEPFVSIPGENQLLPSIGVGLSVSRRLVEMMGGTLEYSREQDSTVFEVRFPTPGAMDASSASRVPTGS